MVVSTFVVAQVAAWDLDSSVSRDRAVVEFDLMQFPSLEGSRKVNKNEIPEFPGVGSSGKNGVWNLFYQSLQFFPLVEKDGKLLVKPPRTANQLWAREGSVEIRFLAPSVYMASFLSQRVRVWVLKSGPWHIQQRALVLRKWMLGVSS
ncbi:hypothetical protein V6N13_114719 [Hibiscus sabdariffa]|uniref:DUF4283 domain-containing protein n=1 Tax=Hibiscus sabdariffa TaxID=183260 RepID=A0ABR2U2Y9_9ROSI